MPLGTLTSPLYAQIEAAAIDAFVEAGPYTQRALASMIAVETGEDASELARRLPQFLKQLEKRGCYQSQPALCGAKVSGPRALTSPRAFNWSPLPFEAPALEVAASSYLRDDDLEGRQKSAVRSALRLVLELPTKCEDESILQACAKLAPEEPYDLALRAYESAQARRLAEQTARNHRTAIRALLRYAATNRLIPLVFPPVRPESLWEERLHEYLPLAPQGRTDQATLTMRSAWRSLEETARQLFGEDIQFDDLTRAMATQVIDHYLDGKARRAVGYAIRRLCHHLADEHDVGPFTEPSQLDLFTVDTPGGRRPALYLRGTNGDAADGDWERLCTILEDLGFPASLTEFLRWYKNYVTLPSLEILRSPDYPPRRQKHRISDKTGFERLTALRALLGAAVHKLEVAKDAHVGLELSPKILGPDVIFGERFQELVESMLAWWEARAKHLPEDALGKGTSGALRQIVINLGMFALGRYEWLRHQRNVKTTTRTTQSGREHVDTLAEEGVEKTPAETAAWDAYRFASAVADALTDLKKDSKGRTRKRNNEFRDIQRILKNTPPSWWIDLQNGMIELFRKKKRAGDDQSCAYHSLVLNAVTLGLLISTGCRIEELCLVRLDVQFNRTKRIIELRVIDRKNGKAHTVRLHDEYLPDDLLDEYLKRSRPWFIAGRPGIKRTTPLKREPVEPHQFLLVSTSGRPFADPKETKDGEKRDEAVIKRRAAQAGQRVQTQMAKMARKFKMTVPSGKFEFGAHPVRGSCGYGIFLLHDEKAAAQYLGDTIDTALDAYSAIDGSQVDSSCLVGFEPNPIKRARDSAAEPIAQDYAAELKELTADYKDGLLTRQEFERAKAALNERYRTAEEDQAA